MTLVGLHTINSDEYENKYFPAPVYNIVHVCVQFSLCKMDIIILFFPNALSVLFVYKFLVGELSFICVCESITKQSIGIIWALRYNSDTKHYKC